MNGKYISNITAGIILLFLLAPTVLVAAGWQTVSVKRLQGLMKEATGLWLVDVRSPAAFEQGHIEGAVNIPADTLTTKRLPKQKSVVLVDDSLGLRRARQAAEHLAAVGMEKLFILDGGLVAWQAEGHPLAGTGNYRKVRMVTPEELIWARENRVPLQVLDLREQRERELAPLAEVAVVTGATLVERIARLRELLKVAAKSAPAGKLERSATTVVILPLAGDATEALERAVRDLPGDVRYLEGGQATWMANPDKRLKLGDACPTCPGGTGGGVKK